MTATLPQACGEVLCAGGRDSRLQLVFSTDERELLRVLYTPDQHTFLIEGKEVALQPEDQPTLHAFIDGSVIELIVGERAGYTKRFYIDGPKVLGIATRVESAVPKTLSAWTIKPISNNRLTSEG